MHKLPIFAFNRNPFVKIKGRNKHANISQHIVTPRPKLYLWKEYRLP